MTQHQGTLRWNSQIGSHPNGDLILVQHQYNNCTTIPYMKVGPSTWDPPSCEGLLYGCCIDVVNLTFSHPNVPWCCVIIVHCEYFDHFSFYIYIYIWDLILVQHQYNNCTTIPHMRVGPNMWDPLSCERLLYSCCIGVVNLTFSYIYKKKLFFSLFALNFFPENAILTPKLPQHFFTT
jgi:hypothetical protein